jgi:hypothetical protein
MKSILFNILLLIIIVSGSEAIKAQSGKNLNQPTNLDSMKMALNTDSIRQVDLVDYIVKIFKVKNVDEKRSKSKVNFSLFPSSSTATGDRASFTSFSAAFLLGDISNTKVSNIYFYPYIGTGGRYGFQLQPNIWLRKNSWNLTGDYFILNYPQSTWGLGGSSPPENETLIDYKHARIHQNIMRGIFPNLSVGLGYAFDEHYDISLEESDSVYIIQAYVPEVTNKSISSGIVFPVLYDNRRNALNPQRGCMVSFTYSFYDPIFGSDNRWQSIFIDARKYFHIPNTRNHIIALRSYYWTILSGKVPYLDLPANRWEPASGSASRGIKQNRYRSNALLYFETEYRFGITANGLLGGVVFANIVSPSQYETQDFIYWHPAAGAGVRIKFNKYSNTNVTLDAGFSKGFWSIYMTIGEVF